jgi:hypothetical protein
MSLKPDPIQPVPEETARVARAAFRKGNPLLKLRDELDAIFADADFTVTVVSGLQLPTSAGCRSELAPNDRKRRLTSWRSGMDGGREPLGFPGPG